MIYARQTLGWGMGNFINCTPAIKWLSLRHQKPIPVLFEEEYLKVMFQDCDFMEIIEESHGIMDEPTVDSKWTNQTQPDYMYLFERISGSKENCPHTYVDSIQNPLLLSRPYVVFIRGGIFGSEPKKDPGQDIYFKIAEEVYNLGYEIIYLGVDRDYTRWSVEFMAHFHNELGELRRKLGILNGAEFVVSNDTGLYHAAGALKKKGFILWKDTPFVKNQSPNKEFTYCVIPDHMKGATEAILDYQLQCFKSWIK